MSIQEERSRIAERVQELVAGGICPACHDIERDEPFGRGDRVIHEDEHFLVVLERFPRMRGHTVVIYKPHRDDFSKLSAEEGAEVMAMCVRVTNAIKHALGAERVYLATMCDGTTHLHLQLYPRYAGDDIGSKRFVLPRGSLDSEREVAGAISASMT